MEKNIVEKLGIKRAFLYLIKEKKLYDKYIKAFKRAMWKYNESYIFCSPTGIISRSFWWTITEEGEDFWNEKNIEINHLMCT